MKLTLLFSQVLCGDRSRSAVCTAERWAGQCLFLTFERDAVNASRVALFLLLSAIFAPQGVASHADAARLFDVPTVVGSREEQPS